MTDDAERRDARRSRERKERLQAQAQRLESLGQLAGGVAHDFNNLLAVILNYVSFVSEDIAAAAGPDPAGHLESASADLGQIKKAAERAAGLTHQLLVFARGDVNRPQVLDLDTVVTEVEELLRRTIGEHVELVISLAGDLWPVLADPGQLEQVLVNLAVNARDAMPRGGTLTIDTGNITVDADAIAGGSRARKGRNVRLRVSDTGTGMAPDVAQHVFEPFFTTKPDGRGTGLGLATVYGILAQADGKVQIYSEPGHGTTFVIMLPVTAEAAVPVAEPIPYRRAPKGETVLIVEDEAALREVTRRIFARNGYQVITAANGPGALAIAASHPGEIHLLVTDVVMPHMLGKEVAEKMRLIKPRSRWSSCPATPGPCWPPRTGSTLAWPWWESHSPRPTCWPRPARYSTATSRASRPSRGPPPDVACHQATTATRQPLPPGNHCCPAAAKGPLGSAYAHARIPAACGYPGHARQLAASSLQPVVLLAHA